MAPGTTLRGLPLFLAGIMTGASGAAAAADENNGGEDEDKVDGSAIAILHSMFTEFSRIGSEV